MSKMSRINVIEKYEEHRFAIHNLLSSILKPIDHYCRCFAFGITRKRREKGRSTVEIKT